MRWFVCLLALCAGLGAASADTPRPGRRVALIVANSEYQIGGTFGTIDNPARDAELVRDALVRAGFDVRVAPNLDRASFIASLNDFGRRADGAEVAIIYYGGHGLSAHGDNWLAPVDLSIASDGELRERAISQTQLLEAVRGARMGVVALDACRDSPFANLSDKPGLSAFEAEGLLLLYAAGSGHRALDGIAGENSPFASAIARRMVEPGVPLQMLPNLVRADVIDETATQRPYASTGATTDPLYLVPGNAGCAEFDRRWMEGLLASADVHALRQFVDASPPTCASRAPANQRIASLSRENGNSPPAAPNGFRDCSTCPLLMALPGGMFEMGSPVSDSDRYSAELPVRRVSVAPFAAGVFEVTFDEWEACVAAGGCGHYMPDDGGWGQGSRPVVSVSWNDAQRYVQWLTARTGKQYRLLSEAEWEYAARGGVAHSTFWWGASADRQYANYGADACCEGEATGPDRWRNTAPVGSLRPNPFGLYDIIGNAWEWVEDCEHADYGGAPADGTPWTTSCLTPRRELRGGSWYDYPRWVRTANRYPDAAIVRSDNYGFRVARAVEE